MLRRISGWTYLLIPFSCISNISIAFSSDLIEFFFTLSWNSFMFIIGFFQNVYMLFQFLIHFFQFFRLNVHKQWSSASSSLIVLLSIPWSIVRISMIESEFVTSSLRLSSVLIDSMYLYWRLSKRLTTIRIRWSREMMLEVFRWD